MWVQCPRCGLHGNTQYGPCANCGQDLDSATGGRRLHDLTRAEYSRAIETDTGELTAGLIWFGGWIPVGIVAIVAGILVGFMSGDWRLALGTALGGTILGYVAAIVAISIYVVLDERWFRLGHQERAWFLVLLSVGPAIALLLAALVLLNA